MVHIQSEFVVVGQYVLNVEQFVDESHPYSFLAKAANQIAIHIGHKSDLGYRHHEYNPNLKLGRG